MPKMRILPLLAAAAMLSPATSFAQVQTAAMAPDATRLDLTVTGKTTRVPDVATISTGVQTRARTAQEAISENATRMKSVIAALRDAGVEERDIRTSQLNLNPQYDHRRENAQGGPELTGYTATNQVSVRFRDIAKSGAIIDALVSAGANQINGPMLSIDDPEAAMDEARADAIAKGRQRAELYAAAMGMRVARIVMVSEGGRVNRPPIMVTGSRAMAMDMAEASTEIVPGEQDVAITLQMSFDLE